MNKHTVIVCIAIQLLFNACFLWYLADIRETTNFNHQRLTEVQLSLIDIQYDTSNSPAPVVQAPVAVPNDDWYEKSQREHQLQQQKQQLDRIEQEQQRVRQEETTKSLRRNSASAGFYN